MATKKATKPKLTPMQQEVMATYLIISLCHIKAVVRHSESYSYITINDSGTGIAELSRDMLRILMATESFAGLHAGFNAGTIILTFK